MTKTFKIDLIISVAMLLQKLVIDAKSLDQKKTNECKKGLKEVSDYCIENYE